MQKNYLFFSDPGHGWLEVPRTDVQELGIESKITAWSYEHNEKIYLEEDCDASLFMETAKQNGWTINIEEKYQENTPIRNYQHYKKPQLIGA